MSIQKDINEINVYIRDHAEHISRIEHRLEEDKPLFDSMVKQVARLMLDVVELQAHLKEQFKRQ